MKHKRIILPAAAIVVLLALGVYVLGAPSHPALTLPRGEGHPLACTFSSDFAVPEEEGKLYALQPEGQREMEQKAVHILGIEDLSPYFNGNGLYYVEETGDTVTIEPNGFFSVTNEGKPIGEPLLPNITEPDLPQEEEAAHIAKQFLLENGLYTGDPGMATVTYTTGQNGPLTADVTFFPGLDGKEVYGIYRLRVSVGDGGKVQGVVVQASPAEELDTVPLKDTRQVMEEIRQKPEALCFLGESPETALLTQCRLAYYTDGTMESGRVYAYPVYVLTGPEPEAFQILLDAATR